MKNLKNEGLGTMETKVRSRKGWRMFFALVLVLVAPILAAYPAEASRPCPAPGGGYVGALNMLHDATMLTIPMANDAPQGNAGMFIAVDNSGC
jgi:hypothetical protein